MNQTDVMNAVTRDEYLLVDKERGFLLVSDREMADKHGMSMLRRAYRFKEPGSDEVEEIDFDKMVNDIIDAVEGNIDIREFLRQALRSNFPEQTIEAHELLIKHPEAVRTARVSPGCIELVMEDPEPGKDKVIISLRG